MTVLLSFFIIKSVTAQLLEERKSVLAAFRSIGAGKTQTNLILICENIVYGFFGGFIGIYVGELIRDLLIVGYFQGARYLTTIRIPFAILEIVYSVFLQLIITFSSLLRASKLSIRENMIKKPETEYELKSHRIYAGLFLLVAALFLRLMNTKYILFLNIIALFSAIVGISLLIPILLKVISSLLSRMSIKLGKGNLFVASKNLFVGKSNVAGTILCFIVSALIVVISTGVSSVNQYYQNYVKNYPYEIFVKCANLNPDEYDFSEDIEDIGQLVVEYWKYGFWNINGNTKKVCMIKEDGYSGIITFYDGKPEKIQSGHAIIDSVLAQEMSIKVGDEVTFFNTKNQNEFIVEIDSLCDSGYVNARRSSILLSSEDYYEYVETSAALIGVDITTPAVGLVSALIEKWIYDKTGESVRVITTQEYLYKDLRNIKAALRALSAFPIVVFLIALIGMLNNQLLSYKTKKRIFSVFYSFGVSRISIKKILVFELVEVYIIGSFLGVAVGQWLSIIFRDIVFRLIAYIDFNVDLKLVFLGVISGLIFLLLASYPIVRNVNKMNITEEIRYE